MKMTFNPAPMWKKFNPMEELYTVAEQFQIKIWSKHVPGCLVYSVLPGYVTDFRSGPSIVNPLIPKIGNTYTALAWMVHDINYHGFLSKDLADKILKEMLEYAGMGAIKRNGVYLAVTLFANGHYNTLDEDQGPIYNRNKTLIRFSWTDEHGMIWKSFNGRSQTKNRFAKG